MGPGSWGVVLVLAGLLAVALWLAWPGFALDYYHDESWRMDVVRTRNPLSRLLDPGTTPVPPGWIASMRLGVEMLPDSYRAARVISFGSFVVWLVATYVLVRTLASPAPGDRSAPTATAVVPPSWVALLSCALLAMTQVAGRHVDYVNNYFFEAAYLTVAVLCALRSPTSGRALRCLIVLLALSPLMLTGGLLAVPPLAICAAAAVRTRTTDDADGLVRWLVVGGTIGTILLAVIYTALWAGGAGSEPVPLAVQWRDEIARSITAVPGLLARSTRQIHDGVVGWSAQGGGWLPLDDARWWVVATAPVVALGAIVGAATAHGRWRWYLGIVAGAQALAVVGSLAVDLPMTAVRSNLGWMLLVYTLIALGLARTVQAAAERATAGRAAAWGRAMFLAGGVMLLGGLWHGPRPASPHWTPRGLAADLQPVADSPAAHNLVLEYVAMTQWTAHDRLINDAPPGRTYDLRTPEHTDADFEYGPLNGLIDASLEPGDALWCVIPHSLPTGLAERACQVGGAPVTQIHASHGTRAEIRGYLVDERPAGADGPGAS